MKVIEDFIKRYNKEFDFYQKLSLIVANKIEDDLLKRGVKAIVTHRAKKPESLKEKLLKRNEKKNYKSVNEIYKDIVDLAGIRIALYFPSERNIVDEIINEIFIVVKKKIFPNEAHTPKYEKRFSGYWANHYRIKIKPEKLTQRYTESVAEIQVASILMHAWSEVEHDLVYKPFSGELSKEELSILDEINGLVLSGEIALERLQSAIAERTKKQNNITDKYELTNFLFNAINKNYKKKLKLGDTFLLNNYLNTIYKLNVEDFTKYINKINANANDSVTDQLLNMLLIESYDSDKLNLKDYFKNLHVSERKASGFEAFVKCWVVLEKAVREILKNEKRRTKKYYIPDFRILSKKNILTKEEAKQLTQLRQVRNYLLHGIETPSEHYLKNSYKILKDITQKVVNNIQDNGIKEKLINDLNSI